MSDDHSTSAVGARAVDRFLAAIEGAAIEHCDAFSPEVALDATVPNWRFSARGSARGASRARTLVRRRR